jgi:hypothetical protein
MTVDRSLTRSLLCARTAFMYHMRKASRITMYINLAIAVYFEAVVLSFYYSLPIYAKETCSSSEYEFVNDNASKLVAAFLVAFPLVFMVPGLFADELGDRRTSWFLYKRKYLSTPLRW